MVASCEIAARDCGHRSAPVASLGYTPRQAERTVLHQVVRAHLESFLATTARAYSAGLPAFLEPKSLSLTNGPQPPVCLRVANRSTRAKV